MKTNKKTVAKPIFTHEGGKASRCSLEQDLNRAVMSCFLWENSFYENGVSIADRIKTLIPKVKPYNVAALAIKARNEGKLRHVPLLIVREMAKLDTHKHLVASTLQDIIQRPDELSEFLSLYFSQGKCPLSNQVKKGLASAFNKFSEYQLSKYNQDRDIKLRDVLFLCHPKPKDAQQESVWKKLANNELTTPDTWEVELSKGGDKKKSWTRLLEENKLRAMALLRNLRNMVDANVDQGLIKYALKNCNPEKVLPFRFISAAKYAPQFEPELEDLMFKSTPDIKLDGRTALIIDTSPSMWMDKISVKSEMDRFEAASALAILLREICDDVAIYAFNKSAYVVPARRGFALRDALAKTKDQYSCGSLAIDMANQNGYDRIICLTDGQWHVVKDGKPTHELKDGKTLSDPITELAYMINVSVNKNSVGYDKWTTIDGFSENIVNFIAETENPLDKWIA